MYLMFVTSIQSIEKVNALDRKIKLLLLSREKNGKREKN